MNHKLNLKKQLACIYTNNFFSGLRITDAVCGAAGRCGPCRAGRPRGADRRGGAWPKAARLLSKKRTAGFLDSRPAMRYNSDRKGTVTSGLASSRV